MGPFWGDRGGPLPRPRPLPAPPAPDARRDGALDTDGVVILQHSEVCEVAHCSVLWLSPLLLMKMLACHPTSFWESRCQRCWL